MRVPPNLQFELTTVVTSGHTRLTVSTSSMCVGYMDASLIGMILQTSIEVGWSHIFKEQPNIRDLAFYG